MLEIKNSDNKTTQKGDPTKKQKLDFPTFRN